MTDYMTDLVDKTLTVGKMLYVAHLDMDSHEYEIMQAQIVSRDNDVFKLDDKTDDLYQTVAFNGRCYLYSCNPDSSGYVNSKWGYVEEKRAIAKCNEKNAQYLRNILTKNVPDEILIGVRSIIENHIDLSAFIRENMSLTEDESESRTGGIPIPTSTPIPRYVPDRMESINEVLRTYAGSFRITT